MTTDSTILLVHGAWHGAWCWEKVVPILEAAGREVVAIDLPTVHAPNKAELGLDDDTRAVSDAIAAIGGPVTVVGHSYGGIPVSQGAASPEVRHIVYIAAFVLDAGESLVGSVGGVEPDWWHVDGLLATAGDENQTPQSLFFGDVEPAEADAAAARLLAQAVAPFRTEQTEPAWKSKPSTYLVTESDAIFPLFAQEALAARAGSRIERLNTSHSPFLSQPAAVAEIILRAARAADEAS